MWSWISLEVLLDGALPDLREGDLKVLLAYFASAAGERMRRRRYGLAATADCAGAEPTESEGQIARGCARLFMAAWIPPIL